MYHRVENLDVVSLYVDLDLIYVRKTCYYSRIDIFFYTDRQRESQGEVEVLLKRIDGFVVATCHFTSEIIYLPSVIQVLSLLYYFYHFV
jgi:hypothetical protein